MRLRLFPLAIVIRTQRGLKDWQAGVTNGPLVRIRPGYEADEGLLEHELVHVAQWWRGVAIGLGAALVLAGVGVAGWLWAIFGGAAAHPLLYRILPKYRLQCEVDAYRLQALHYPDDRRTLFAGFIASRYSLNITGAEAERLLS